MNQKGFIPIILLAIILFVVGICGEVYLLNRHTNSSFSLISENIPAPNQTFPKLTGKIAFIRQGNIWLANGDGSSQTKISTLPNQNYCQYYTISAGSDYIADYIGGESAWSKDGNKLAYYCPDLDHFNSSKLSSLMYIYDLQSKQTKNYSTTPDPCHGCTAIVPINFNLLINNTDWQNPYSYEKSVFPILHQLFPLKPASPNIEASQIDQVSPVGGSIYLLAPDSNAISNPNKDDYWLYDLIHNRILYRWDGGRMSHEYNHILYTYYTDIPRCSLNITGTDIACEVTLFRDESESTGNIRQLLIYSISTNQVKSIYQVSIPFNSMWSTDGSSIYYDYQWETEQMKLR